MRIHVPDVATEKDSRLVLDTNILQYSTGSKFSESLTSYIEKTAQNGRKPFISEISVCELFSGCTRKQESENTELISELERYNVNAEVLLMAARLQNLYRYYCVDGEGINLGDRIIAATAIVTGSDVLTANVNDFPRPIFKEKHEEIFYFRKKNKTNIQVVQVLSPNLELMESY